jgi:hypothetical protein
MTVPVGKGIIAPFLVDMGSAVTFINEGTFEALGTDATAITSVQLPRLFVHGVLSKVYPATGRTEDINGLGGMSTLKLHGPLAVDYIDGTVLLSPGGRACMVIYTLLVYK